MKKAGCSNIRYGVEAGTSRVRNDIIGKKISNKTIQKAIKLSKKIGLTIVAYFMFGNPTENLSEIKQTVKFADELNSDFVDFHLPIPIPGSRLFAEAIREKKFDINIWNRVIEGENIPVYTPNGLNLETVSKFQRIIYKRFYLNPFKIINTFFNPRNAGDTLNRLKSGIVVLNNLI